jgi:hypothetical protein
MENMSETSGSALVQRMRMARRVADALLPQEDGVELTSVAAADDFSTSRNQSEIRADFAITALDLKLILCLLVNPDADALNDPSMLEAANMILWKHPESAACVLIVNDTPLTSRIIEWGDRTAGSPHSEVATVIPKHGPLRRTIMGYLSTVSFPWPEPRSLNVNEAIAFDDVAGQAAFDAVAKLQTARRSPIPERSQARASLGSADAQWAVRLALSVANNDSLDLDKELTLQDPMTGDRQ